MDEEITSAYQYKSLFERALEALSESTNSAGQGDCITVDNIHGSTTDKRRPGNPYQRYLSISSGSSDSQIERPWTSPATTNSNDYYSNQRPRSPVRKQTSIQHKAKRKISTSTTMCTKHDVRSLTPEKTCQRNINNWLAFNENIQKRCASADRYNSLYRNKRTVCRTISPENARTSKRGRSRQKKKMNPDYLVLNDGEVFSPILWRKFHIDDHLFDTAKLTDEEILENMNQMKIKYPHLTKYYNQNDNYDISNTIEDKRQRLFNKLPEQSEDEKHATQNYLWKRHVDMMKVSKSTSYYNFLSHFDRQSCRACSHSKTCSSKHCGSCDCGTKCEKHAINIDFLKYRPYTSVSNEHADNNETNKDSKKQVLGKQNHNLKSDSRFSSKNHGLTMQGFTIMRKTPDMGRRTLLSTHIDGQHCTSKSGHKKCLACAMAKENVLMQSRKKPLLHPKSAPARLRRLNIVRSSSVPPPAI